jgi:hypothetical protein
MLGGVGGAVSGDRSYPDINNQQVILLIVFAFQEPGRLSNFFFYIPAWETSKLAFVFSQDDVFHVRTRF